MSFLDISVQNSVFLETNPNFFSWVVRWMVGGPNGTGLTPQKPQIFGEKMLRLLEFFGGKNSSPIFSKLVRARDSNPFILLVGTIKPYNLYY